MAAGTLVVGGVSATVGGAVTAGVTHALDRA
jgi:hypothetical protein